MKVVAYCRVSTNKEEQLDSLESQQKFFGEYSKRNGYSLIKIYADEGKSGTKMKNRTELLKMLSDANKGLFDVVLIKDVSRLARNTLDFLTSIRKLKALGIKVIFVNYDQTSSDSSEFMLTMLSAIAQEESANISKRVKFGKKINAEKGRVPNLIYGYDKIPGDYFNLSINETESAVVKQIFDMYTEKNMGENRIALELNRRGLKTKRNCKWSQNAVARILSNEIYIGKIVNGKETVEDFLTGKRTVMEKENWLVTVKTELRIINDDVFEMVKKIKNERHTIFNLTGERKVEKNVFSKLIKCTCCGASFRRQVRSYKNTYIKWVCSGRNYNGTDSCPNKTVIDEQELLSEIKNYFISILKDKPNSVKSIISEFNKQYKKKSENELTEKDLCSQLQKLKKSKQKYLDMFDNDIITMSELKAKTSEFNKLIFNVEERLKIVRLNISKSDLLKANLNETFKDIEDLLKEENITNNLLSRVIEKITVDENGKIDVYLRLLSDVGLENAVQLLDCHT